MHYTVFLQGDTLVTELQLVEEALQSPDRAPQLAFFQREFYVMRRRVAEAAFAQWLPALRFAEAQTRLFSTALMHAGLREGGPRPSQFAQLEAHLRDLEDVRRELEEGQRAYGEGEFDVLTRERDLAEARVPPPRARARENAGPVAGEAGHEIVVD